MANTDELVKKIELLARLITVQLVHKNFADLKQTEQIKILDRHGLKNKEISSLLGVKAPNVSKALKN